MKSMTAVCMSESMTVGRPFAAGSSPFNGVSSGWPLPFFDGLPFALPLPFVSLMI
jgi:hypothetical protein